MMSKRNGSTSMSHTVISSKNTYLNNSRIVHDLEVED